MPVETRCCHRRREPLIVPLSTAISNGMHRDHRGTSPDSFKHRLLGIGARCLKSCFVKCAESPCCNYSLKKMDTAIAGPCVAFMSRPSQPQKGQSGLLNLPARCPAWLCTYCTVWAHGCSCFGMVREAPDNRAAWPTRHHRQRSCSFHLPFPLLRPRHPVNVYPARLLTVADTPPSTGVNGRATAGNTAEIPRAGVSEQSGRHSLDPHCNTPNTFDSLNTLTTVHPSLVMAQHLTVSVTPRGR